MTPFERSRAALPSDIRRTLEESNLPIEVATAIADLCEQRAEEVTRGAGRGGAAVSAPALPRRYLTASTSLRWSDKEE